MLRPGPGIDARRGPRPGHRLANATPFGLTSGLHTLDDREITRWLERIEAGNLYVNRPVTGAIVGRQLFGGWKASSVGPGAKAGLTVIDAPILANGRLELRWYLREQTVSRVLHRYGNVPESASTG